MLWIYWMLLNCILEDDENGNTDVMCIMPWVFKSLQTLPDWGQNHAQWKTTVLFYSKEWPDCRLSQFQHYWNFGWGHFFVVAGAVLCIAGCLPTSLVSTHWMPGTPPSGNNKNICKHCPLGGKKTPSYWEPLIYSVLNSMLLYPQTP